MNNKTIVKHLYEISSYSITVSDLLHKANEEYCFTLDGALNAYKTQMKCNTESAAYWWMNEHYSRIMATMRACGIIADDVNRKVDWLLTQQ